jgi:hypothetical protein
LNTRNRPQTPYIPPPPALPRFALPHEGRDGGAEVDPLDVASTSQRPTIRPGSRPASVRVRKKIAADQTEEVQLEDILLEVYAEEPPPPMTRRSPGVDPRTGPPRVEARLAESGEAHASIAMAIASIVPPAPAQSAAVDALLRASDPSFAPYGFVPRSGHYATASDYETPSVSPMMLATAAPPARPVLRDARAGRPNRGLAIAIWATVIMVVGVAAGAAMVMAVRNGTYARLRDSAKTAAARATSKHDAPIVAAASAAPVDVPAAAPPATVVAPPPQALVAPPVAAPAPVPTVSIDSLPKPAIAADASLVTFPAYAQGHRVFLDGRVLPVVEGTPTKIKCGRHMLKIGSARKPRVVDFACGREVIVQ